MQLVRDTKQIQMVHVAIFIKISGSHINILLIVKVEILFCHFNGHIDPADYVDYSNLK